MYHLYLNKTFKNEKRTRDYINTYIKKKHLTKSNIYSWLKKKLSENCKKEKIEGIKWRKVSANQARLDEIVNEVSRRWHIIDITGDLNCWT